MTIVWAESNSTLGEKRTNILSSWFRASYGMKLKLDEVICMILLILVWKDVLLLSIENVEYIVVLWSGDTLDFDLFF